MVLTSSFMQQPRSVAIEDLDGDGDTDISVANLESNNITIFRQASPRVFDPLPLVLSSGNLLSPHSVVAIDLDGDGSNDLITGNTGTTNLTIFFAGH